ncbi:hypothetical protein EHZ25_37220, partial [Paraburkholderia tropica]
MNERDDGLFGALENDGSGLAPEGGSSAGSTTRRPRERRAARAVDTTHRAEPPQTDLFGFVPPELPKRAKTADVANASSDSDPAPKPKRPKPAPTSE